MPGTLTAKAISNRVGSVTIPLSELTTRVIQQHEETYSGGEWNPTTIYQWIPGSFVDFTPLRSDSLIVYQYRVPMARWRGQTHAISHWRFYVNNVIYYWHSVEGVHLEDGSTLVWEVPSWGTTSGRIGYQMRAHTNDNHEVRIYSTDYWDGVDGSRQAGVNGQLIVEEIAGTHVPTTAGLSSTWYAR